MDTKVTPSPKCVLCFSGGLDSTVLLYKLLKEGYDVHCLSVYYGQRHEKELESARLITSNLGIWNNFHEVNFRRTGIQTLLKGSSQTSDYILVPEGHYTDDSMRATVVPNRNMILLSLATAWAISLKAVVVVYAAHTGDHTIYPDCRPEFIEAMEEAICLCDESEPILRTPFSSMTKADIVKLGVGLGVPFEKTYSCYKGGEKHCGRCGTCVERIEAFTLAKVPDPTQYECGIRKYGPIDTTMPG